MVIKMKGKGIGWHGESRRHSLARKGVKTIPTTIHKKKEFGSSLSPEGKKLLKLYGFSEDYVPYIWKEELETGTQPNSPYYLTIDFVLDSEMRKEYNELREDEETGGTTGEWLSQNLWGLIDRNFILDIYDDELNRINIDEFKEKYDDLVLIYGGY